MISYIECNLGEQGTHSKPLLLEISGWRVGLILGRCMETSPQIGTLSSSNGSQ